MVKLESRPTVISGGWEQVVDGRSSISGRVVGGYVTPLGGAL